MSGTSAFERLAAALADRYTVERELGQGGMATVYLAEDLKHHRKVAIKVLREDLAASMGAGRFLREIQIAAQLQHPNILPLLDSGESDGLLFYVMPYVAGQSLRERIDREGELPVHEGVRLIGDVVDALIEAHAHGVVHRDIKPDNVMLAGRHALVTDFGVAKAISEATGRNTVTTLGVAVGTPAYMSPEQAAADPHVDHRSDIYSVGVMAYEALTGQPPFSGSTPQQVLAAHVTQEPEAITRRRSAIPIALETVIMRCLAKRPADRWQSAAELHAALEPFGTPSMGVTPTQTAPMRAVRAPRNARPLLIGGVALLLIAAAAWWRFGGHGAGSGTIRALAVLPFDNAGHDTAYDYLADGMANDVREALMKLPGLSVKARTSSEAERGKSIHDAGTQLGVGALLQGAFHPSGDHITVTVDLVKVADETALWSRDFELPADGNFSSAQDSITAAVAKALRLVVAQGGPGTAEERGTGDQQAYDLYLRGEFFFARRGADNMRRAIDYYHQAIARDSNFARAYAGLSVVEGVLPAWAAMTGDSIVRDAEAMARRALALDPNLAEAHVALANALTDQLRPAEAETEYQRAIALDPRSETAHQWRGDNLVLLGRTADGVQEGEAAVALDPLSAVAYNDLAYSYLCAGRYRDATIAARRALELDSTFTYARIYEGQGLLFAGQPDSAAIVFRGALAADSTFPLVRPFAIWGLVLQGRWAEAEREAALLPMSASDDSRGIAIAAAQVALGNTATALDALEHAVKVGSVYVGETALGCDPTLAVLHGEPRFVAIVKQAGQGMCAATVKWPIPPRK